MLNLVENILLFYLGGVSGNAVIAGKSVGCITGNNGIFFILIQYIYLTEYRMERASRMLMETNEKSYIIARNVGYTDPNYFSYVFKRRFGVSPSKYRMEHGSCE